MLAAAAALAEGAPDVAEAFARTRLAAPRGGTFGTADLATAEVATLLERALARRLMPELAALSAALSCRMAVPHGPATAMESNMNIRIDLLALGARGRCASPRGAASHRSARSRSAAAAVGQLRRATCHWRPRLAARASAFGLARRRADRRGGRVAAVSAATATGPGYGYVRRAYVYGASPMHYEPVYPASPATTTAAVYRYGRCYGD